MYSKEQFESPKHLHETTFETLKYYNKQCFETTHLVENGMNLLKQKVAKNVAISLGYSTISK